jgi:hypothetical protein
MQLLALGRCMLVQMATSSRFVVHAAGCVCSYGGKVEVGT